MSIQGKKIASLKMALECATQAVNVACDAVKVHGVIGGIMMHANKKMWEARLYALNTTPHQHFNAKGKMDKRKVKRHRAKQGMTSHNTYLVRGNK